MVLADFSGALPGPGRPQPQRGGRRGPLGAAAAVAALALVCLTAVAFFAPRGGGGVALEGHGDITDAALNAEHDAKHDAKQPKSWYEFCDLLY